MEGNGTQIIEPQFAAPVKTPVPARSVRTGEDDLFNKPVEITMGGASGDAAREYLIKELPIRAAKEWQRKFEAQITAIIEIEESEKNGDGKQGAAMHRIISEIPDIMTDLLFEYVPAMKADREWLLDNATQSQVIDALKAVLSISLPFVKRLKELFNLNQ